MWTPNTAPWHVMASPVLSATGSQRTSWSRPGFRRQVQARSPECRQWSVRSVDHCAHEERDRDYARLWRAREVVGALRELPHRDPAGDEPRRKPGTRKRQAKRVSRTDDLSRVAKQRLPERTGPNRSGGRAHLPGLSHAETVFGPAVNL